MVVFFWNMTFLNANTEVNHSHDVLSSIEYGVIHSFINISCDFDEDNNWCLTFLYFVWQSFGSIPNWSSSCNGIFCASIQMYGKISGYTLKLEIKKEQIDKFTSVSKFFFFIKCRHFLATTLFDLMLVCEIELELQKCSQLTMPK